MTRMKTDRDWFVRWIICIHLIAVSRRSKAVDMVKAMNGGLALKSLSKAVSDAVSSTQDGTAKNQSVQSQLMRTTSDIDLLIEIYRRHGKHAELVNLLADIEKSALSSKLGGSSIYAKEKIDALMTNKDWTSLLELSDVLLRADLDIATTGNDTSARLSDDWLIWKGYLAAFTECCQDRPEYVEVSKMTINTFVKDRKSTNARLAWMILLLQNPDTAEKLDANVVDVCAAYFHEVGTKPLPFSHLRQCWRLNAKQKQDYLRLCRSDAEARADDQRHSQVRFQKETL